MALDAARAKSLFLEASDLADPVERTAYLERECGDDAALHARVEALLKANDISPLPPAAPENSKHAHPMGHQPLTVDSIDPTACVGSIVAGKYKLIEEIGAGGMGSVYMAQQTNPVKRAVAVKVIKAGMDSKTVLARFEAERQALAIMDHPNIARVLDAGTTEAGRPFFVMELVKGVPFTQFCDERKLTPRQRLELFLPVCQAIQHAHQKGVIHRDIKPSNVLVALYDDRPVPKVIDFGVAKAAGQSLTDMTLMTGYGAVVGTPEYMSPEQASLNNLDIDTRSDVYSLGVLLYELLTGTTPVDRNTLGKAALLEVLRIVREVEPQRPSLKLSTIVARASIAANRGTEPAQLSRLLRGELDWVVLKALEKDRTRRYDSANGLARDIQRYLADEVVEARPPSTGYRVRKFVSKNRGAVIAASLVLLTLLSGIAGTTWGLIRADQEAANARRHEDEAKHSEATAILARNDLLSANTKLALSHEELLKSSDSLLNSAARSLLRPLALQVQADAPLPPLNAQEIDALSELAATKDELLRLRFVAVALQSPSATRRLKDRGEFALHAAVGLNGTRRKQVEQLLANHLHAKDTKWDQKAHIALCLTNLDGLNESLAAQTAAVLTEAMSQTTEANALQRLSEGLSRVATSLESKAAAQTAATLFQVIIKTTDPIALNLLFQGLAAVASRLEPKDAAQMTATFFQAITKTTDPNRSNYLSLGLATVVSRVETKDAAQIVATITLAMTKTTDPIALYSLSQVLLTVASELEPKDAASTATTIAQAMTKMMEVNALQLLSQCLAAVASRLDPKDAAQTVATLLQALTKTTDANALYSLSQGLAAVAARLEPKDAAQTVASLLRALTKTTDANALYSLSQGLAAVAARLETKDAAEVCGQAAATLAQVMTKTTEANALNLLFLGLTAVAAHLEPKDAALTAATLAQAMTKTTDENTFSYLSQGLAAVAARLEPKDASPLCGQAAATVVLAMTKTTEANALNLLFQGLAAITARLEPKDAARTAATLIQAITTTTDGYTLNLLSQGLAGVATRLEPKDAARICGQAAATLAQAMTKTTDANILSLLFQGLTALAAHLEPKGAALTAATLVQAMTQTTDMQALSYLSRGLAAVTARLEPKDAAVTAATLTQAITTTTNANALINLSQGLTDVAARLEPKDAASTAATLTQAITKTTDENALDYLFKSLAVVAARLESNDAASAAATLSQGVTKTTDTSTLCSVSQGLAAVARHLKPKDAARVCGQAAAILAQAVTKTTDASALNSLSQGLAAVAPHLETKDAARVCGQVAANLALAITNATDPGPSSYLSLALAAVVPHLDPKDAAQTTATLMVTTVNAHDLLTVLNRESAETTRQRPLSVAATIGVLIGSVQPFAAFPCSQPALEPMPPPLPSQMLVDLLKNPFCVDEARRLVLAQLARHYDRSFADQWEFVDFVHAHKLDLDLTTPPERPREMP